MVRLEEVKPRSPARCVGVRWIGWSFWAWLVALESAVEEVKPRSPSNAGWGVPKIPKSSKIPVVPVVPVVPVIIDVIGEPKRLP